MIISHLKNSSNRPSTVELLNRCLLCYRMTGAATRQEYRHCTCAFKCVHAAWRPPCASDGDASHPQPTSHCFTQRTQVLEGWLQGRQTTSFVLQLSLLFIPRSVLFWWPMGQRKLKEKTPGARMHVYDFVSFVAFNLTPLSCTAGRRLVASAAFLPALTVTKDIHMLYLLYSGLLLSFLF